MGITKTIYATFDAHVNSSNPTTNYGSVDSLISGEIFSGSNHYQSFIKFDIATQIPTNATITASTLKLIIQGNDANVGRTFTCFKSGTDWTEGAITWTNKPSAGTALGTSVYVAAESVGATKSYTLTASEIQTIYEGTDYGFIIKVDGEDNDDAHNHYSRHNGTAGNRPQLELTYTVPIRRTMII